ncbi:MAG: GNAT family N-acetyltransferase [Odoribacter sp.]
MVQIDKEKIYSVEEYEYVNFISLSITEKIEVLSWRNNPVIRKWMKNTELIDEESHLKFVDNLKERQDIFYWVVRKNGKAIGCYNIIHIDNINKACESGIYFIDTTLSGLKMSYEMIINSFIFTFQVLGFKRMYAHTHEDNDFMLKLNEYAGYKRIGKDSQNFLELSLGNADFERNYKEGMDFRKFISQFR